MDAQDGADLCFPQLINTSCKKPASPEFQRLLLHIVMSFLSLVTVVLNLLVIISVSHFRKLQTPTNILLLSLAVSDCLVGLVMTPGHILTQRPCWFLGILPCSLYHYTSFIITSASVGNMVLISVDRYVAICDPLHYPTRVTERRVKLWVCLCWLGSVLYNILFIKAQLGSQYSCYGECLLNVELIGGTVDLVFTFILPVSVIIVLYLRVFVVAVSQARAMRSHTAAVTLQLSVNSSTKKSELKAARTLGIVVLVFLMCFCPYYCVSLAGGSEFYTFLVSCILYCNSCLNPVIYAMFYPWFRKAIKLIVTLQILQPDSREANML
ncbi:trace amine-associated receptor 13c-like [Stegastes partitus]|uniref:Trace amine-associated receptor 13c-like n=2 Tax=Stegastes partitus TaxID=144197 RepID=A0A9Y4NTH6_9TELE|nr:PREDICTED: trace amine-associated receptor 13c-like [Stegastes partitus]